MTTYHEAIMALARIDGYHLANLDERRAEGAPATRSMIAAIAADCETVRAWMEAHPDRPLTGAEAEERSRVEVLTSIDARLARLEMCHAKPVNEEPFSKVNVLSALTAGASALAVTLTHAHRLGIGAVADDIITDIVGEAVAQELQRLRERVAEIETDVELYRSLQSTIADDLQPVLGLEGEWMDYAVVKHAVRLINEYRVANGEEG